MFCNFLSPIRTSNSNPYNQSTNTTTYNSYVKESLSLNCSLYIKNESAPINQISDNCTLYMKVINEKSYEYTLNIRNNDKSQPDLIQLTLDKECRIFKFNYNFKNKCLMIIKNSNKVSDIYILELFQSDKEIIIFLEKLEILQISSNLKISIQAAIKEQKNGKYIVNCGNINDINLFIDNTIQKDNPQSQNEEAGEDVDMSMEYDTSVNNSFYLDLIVYDNQYNNFINKNEFMKNFAIYKEIYICQGKAFIYNKYTGNVVPIEEPKSPNEFDFLKINKIGYNIYLLLIEKNDKIVAFTKIEKNVDISISEEFGTMTFVSQNYKPKGETCAYTFSFKDKSLNEINFIKNIIIRCLYERNNYIQDLSQDQLISSFDSIDYSMDCDIIEDNYSFLSSKSRIVDIGQYSLVKNIKDNENAKNKIILQTYNNHRTFVIKDNNNIDIFKTNNEDDKLIGISSLSPIKIKDNEFTFSSAKMFKNDNEILFQDSKDRNKLYQYDLNKEKIVQEWDCDSNKSIFCSYKNNINNYMIDFTYPRKLGQLNEQNQIVGINSNNLYLLDGRVNRQNKIVDIKNYSINTDFTSLVTTGFGGIATGSKNGDIRLFNEMGNNAKTLITGFDCPIRYIDCSVDGKYILATCDNHIMVINTENEYNKNGFEACLGRIKVKPLILKLSSDDLIRYNIENESFTPAKFNNNTNSKEMMIISSLGKYVILWNFTQVQNGQADLYRIINANEFVIDNTTKFDKNQIIIALSDKVRLQNEKLLKD